MSVDFLWFPRAFTRIWLLLHLAIPKLFISFTLVTKLAVGGPTKDDNLIIMRIIWRPITAIRAPMPCLTRLPFAISWHNTSPPFFKIKDNEF